MSIRRSADAIYWSAPSGDSCSLMPMSGGAGLLEIELIDDVVAVHSRNCILVSSDDEFTELAEYEFTVSLQRCQIHWSFAERTEENEVERSAYFSQ